MHFNSLKRVNVWVVAHPWALRVRHSCAFHALSPCEPKTAFSISVVSFPLPSFPSPYFLIPHSKRDLCGPCGGLS